MKPLISPIVLSIAWACTSLPPEAPNVVQREVESFDGLSIRYDIGGVG